MKYEITQKQMDTFCDIYSSLFYITHDDSCDVKTSLKNVHECLYGLLQRIEMQDVEDAT